MGSTGVDEPQYVVAKYDYIAQGNQVSQNRNADGQMFSTVGSSSSSNRLKVTLDWLKKGVKRKASESSQHFWRTLEKAVCFFDPNVGQ